MTYFVYVLRNEVTGKFYKGQTQDLQKRLKEHASSHTKTTSNHSKFWKLIYYEVYLDRNDATGREKFLKSGAGRTFLKKQLKHYFNLV